MEQELIELTINLKRNQPAAREEIDAVQKFLNITFPNDYVEWMLISSGGSGKIGPNSYINLWPVEKLVSLNKANQDEKFTPGLIFFGSDGGDEGYAFDTRAGSPSIVQIPFIEIGFDYLDVLGNTFLEFLRYLSRVV